VRPGDVFRAEYAHLGAVTARFSNEHGSSEHGSSEHGSNEQGSDGH